MQFHLTIRRKGPRCAAARSSQPVTIRAAPGEGRARAGSSARRGAAGFATQPLTAPHPPPGPGLSPARASCPEPAGLPGSPRCRRPLALPRRQALSGGRALRSRSLLGQSALSQLLPLYHLIGSRDPLHNDFPPLLDTEETEGQNFPLSPPNLPSSPPPPTSMQTDLPVIGSGCNGQKRHLEPGDATGCFFRLLYQCISMSGGVSTAV